MRVLVLNAGSSSLKASVLDGSQTVPLAATSISWGSDASRLGGRHDSARRAIDQLVAAGVASDSISAVGHRMVHGGTLFGRPTLIDDQLLAELARLAELAPLHNTVALETIASARQALPGVPHVCVFDTGFHAGLPAEAHVYPLPWRWYEDWGIRRYGFHGLSIEWAVRRAAELLGRPAAALNLVVAHLGSGCSVTAVMGGKSQATSMGMTPLEGLMMGTRSGSVDPGVLLDVLRRGRVDLSRLAEVLDHESGLLGVSGVSGDVRELEQAAGRGDEQAGLALAIFVRRAAEAIAAAATSLDGLDALVFTGGIGEHAGWLRARIVGRLGVLGLAAIGPAEDGTDRLLSGGGPPHVLRIEAREDLVISGHVAELLAEQHG